MARTTEPNGRLMTVGPTEATPYAFTTPVWIGRTGSTLLQRRDRYSRLPAQFSEMRKRN